MNPVQDDARELLIDGEVVTNPTSNSDWPCFLNMEKDTPHNCVTIYGSIGPNPSFCTDPSIEPVRYSRFHIIVRGLDYSETWAKVNSIQAILQQTGTFDLNDCHYADIQETMDPFLMPHDDEHNRFRWSLNFIAIRRKTG